MLEALNREIRDKNRQLQEQAAQIAEWNARLEVRVAEQVARIGQMSKLTRFLSPKVSDLIMSGDADDPLKTRRREITVVFVDLRGFEGRDAHRGGVGRGAVPERLPPAGPHPQRPGSPPRPLRVASQSTTCRQSGAPGAVLGPTSRRVSTGEPSEQRADLEPPLPRSHPGIPRP
jgi:hypothetical protein